MKRSALCHCGQMKITADGDPEHVIICNCTLCQRRTGTTYNMSAWFDRSAITIQGEVKQYVRTGDEGVEIEFKLCPECGTTMYWEIPALFPDGAAVAVGCFADPDFPAPTMSLYSERRYRWVPKPENIPSHVGFLDSELE